jgi:hypothetical protein
MYSEESKVNDRRESISNPQPKLKDKPFNNGVVQGSIESDLMVGSITNSSGLPSYIGRGRPNQPAISDSAGPVIEVTDYKKLLELIMNNAQQTDGSQLINVSMSIGNQKLNLNLNPH